METLLPMASALSRWPQSTIPRLVVPAIAQELGIPEIGTQPLFEQVQASLHDKHLLLILDNFEQVMGASAQIEEMCASCLALKIVVTSRAVLHLQAEQEFTVPPLALPNLHQLPDHEALSDYAAVSLFVRRAQAIQPAFQITATNARTIAEICVRLERITAGHRTGGSPYQTVATTGAAVTAHAAIAGAYEWDTHVA